MHGDEYDVVTRCHRWIVFLGDVSYTILLNRHLNALRSRLGYGYWSLSAWIKHRVKRAVSSISDFEPAVWPPDGARTAGADRRRVTLDAVSDDLQAGGDPAALEDLARRLEVWRPRHTGTLMFLRREGHVLLIRKRRGHGAGRINGPGGKVEAGETALECALRETREEVGVRAVDVRLAGVLRFVDCDVPGWLGYVYVSNAFSGTPRTTAEAIPGWYPAHALPLEEMWDSDRHWLPRLLDGQRLEGDFLFRAGRLLAYRLRPLAATHGGDRAAR